MVWGSPGGSVVKNPPANAGDTDSIPGSERSPEEENGNSSVLAWEIPRTGAWQAIQGIFPSQGSNPHLLKSPALAGRFFTTGPPGKSQDKS